MKYRRFGKTNWKVSEVGYGMWGMGGWSGSDDIESADSLRYSVELGCNFFDTAWAYGKGHSERLLRALVREHPTQKLYVATKIPPKNLIWPSRREFNLEDCFPPEHIYKYVEKSLKNLGVDSIDLIQLHTWEDSWLTDKRLEQTIYDLRRQGLVQAVGISINRWEPWNGVGAVRSGLIDAVQVIYNIFDQNPEDELFPACQEMDVAVIARVPFDEGSLTGTLTADSRWPEGDWRNTYFVPENIKSTLQHVEGVKALLPESMSLPEMALRFILNNATVSTIIPGMRKRRHVQANLSYSDAGPLPEALHGQLAKHRWVRTPTSWSQ